MTVNREQAMLTRHSLRPSTEPACLRLVLGLEHTAAADCWCRAIQQRSAVFGQRCQLWDGPAGTHVLTAELSGGDIVATFYDFVATERELLSLGIGTEVGDAPWDAAVALWMFTAAPLGRRATLANWCRAVLLDGPVDVEDKVVLSARLNALGVLPRDTWESIPTDRLDDAAVDELFVMLRAIAERNEVLGEALRNWEILHGHAFEES